MELHTNYITDKQGRPISVVIPFDEYKKMVEEYGIDLTKEEIKSIRKNKVLRANSSEKIDKEYTDIDNL